MSKAIGFNERGRRDRARKLKRAIAGSMKMAGHTYREIAEALDYSVSTVHAIVRHEGPIMDQLAEEIIKREGKRHRVLSEYILSRITDGDLAHASLKEKVIASAILTDKAILLDSKLNKPTQTPPKTEQNAEQSEQQFLLENQEVTQTEPNI